MFKLQDSKILKSSSYQKDAKKATCRFMNTIVVYGSIEPKHKNYMKMKVYDLFPALLFTFCNAAEYSKI